MKISFDLTEKVRFQVQDESCIYIQLFTVPNKEREREEKRDAAKKKKKKKVKITGIEIFILGFGNF